jgi:TetR/AcrR family transcriptional regulator, transcriptional repressor for nem operon
MAGDISGSHGLTNRSSMVVAFLTKRSTLPYTCGVAKPDTRQRLIDTAMDLMLHSGYQAASVDELCRLAGAQKGSFYHFFPTKADLALSALEFGWTQVRRPLFEAAVADGGPGLEKLRRLVEASDALQRQHWKDRHVLGSQVGALGQEMAHRDPRIRAAVAAIFETQVDYISGWLDEAAMARQIGPGDNHRRARDILALIEGAHLLCRVAGDPGVFPEVCEAIPFIAGRLQAPFRPSPATVPEFA